MPVLTLFAGINGAGKTTLYNEISKNTYAEDLGIRICSDEILQDLNLDWQNGNDQFRSGKIAVKLLEECLKNKQTFNWEFTIITPYVLNNIKRAYELGYTINLYFIGVESVDLSLKRVNKRVMFGGHGIDEALIRTRHSLQFNYLYEILPYVHCAFFYDNLSQFDLVGTYLDNEMNIFDSKSWLGRFENGFEPASNNFVKMYQENYKMALLQSKDELK